MRKRKLESFKVSMIEDVKARGVPVAMSIDEILDRLDCSFPTLSRELRRQSVWYDFEEPSLYLVLTSRSGEGSIALPVSTRRPRRGRPPLALKSDLEDERMPTESFVG